MKKKFYFRAKPTWSGGSTPNRYLKSFNLEGPFVKSPAASGGGIVIEFDLDIDEDLFKPPSPKVEMKIDRDDKNNTVIVSGLRTRSAAAQALRNQGSP